MAGSALPFSLPGTVEGLLLRTKPVLAPVLSLVRVVSVPPRFRVAVQPSRPCRTRPDS
ncbi:DUF6332 family protein [Streptomyces sp. M2CJ-2]|uniref:DUF6332 family protein n=1 Tax=Streptomyces sp. M2CJ-2 TaxID=2803948 RepID=UPI001F47D70E|nr:DUF6332 family protein [Streptomyces sp. M2CJ-2]